jgi:hypothetical protein
MRPLVRNKIARLVEELRQIAKYLGYTRSV